MDRAEADRLEAQRVRQEREAARVALLADAETLRAIEDYNQHMRCLGALNHCQRAKVVTMQDQMAFYRSERDDLNYAHWHMCLRTRFGKRRNKVRRAAGRSRGTRKPTGGRG